MSSPNNKAQRNTVSFGGIEPKDIFPAGLRLRSISGAVWSLENTWHRIDSEWFFPELFEAVVTANPEVRSLAERLSKESNPQLLSELRGKIRNCFRTCLHIISKKYDTVEDKLILYFIEKARYKDAWDADLIAISKSGGLEPTSNKFAHRF